MKYMANEDYWKEDSEDQLYVPPKSKKTAKAKKMEYDGWASKPLIEFLKEIGKETEKKISQQELTTIVNEYVNKNNLIKPSKKKRVECDEWLRYLFGKKYVLRIKIHEFLFPHLAENRDDSSDDEDSTNSEEGENGKTVSRKRKALGNKVAPISKKVPETPKSCFASIIPENIKLVYLTRNLVQELLKDLDTFESKVMGSYVRIKTDPYYYSQENSHQLLQVTGVRKDPACGDASAAYFLQVPHLVKEIPVCKLSNENFKKEECDDLLQRIKAGSANRPTVLELQRKAQNLHEVIIKQWIAKELTLLQNLIDRANEKGWRKELFEYLPRKELLQKPAEQERLLLEVPNVIAEELEPEAIVQEPAEDEKNDVCCSPQLNIARNRADIPFDVEADKSLSNDNFGSTDSAEQLESEAIVQEPAVNEKNYICSSPQATISRTWAHIPCDTEADKPEAISLEPAEDEKSGICRLPQLTIARTSADMRSDAEADRSSPNNNFWSTNDAGVLGVAEVHKLDFEMDVDREGNRTYSNGTTYVKETNGVLGVAEMQKLDFKIDVDREGNRTFSNGTTYVKETNGVLGVAEMPKLDFKIDVDREGNRTYSNGTTHVKETNGVLGVAEMQKLDFKMEPSTYVIDLSDDDEEGINDTPQIVDPPESKLWYYTDPQQIDQGPFSMVTLKRWNENLFFSPGFMIWKSGHSPVRLEDMISLMFPS